MSSEKQQNLQDVFLNNVERQNSSDDFSGLRRKARESATWFDNFCVLLRRDAHSIVQA